MKIWSIRSENPEGQVEKTSYKPAEIPKSHIDAIRNIVTIKQLVEVVLAPLYILTIIKTCMIFRRLPEGKKVDAALNITSNVKDIGENAGAFVGALDKINKIPTTKIAWLGPFAVVMAGLSLASITNNIRTCMRTRELLREIRFAENSGKVDGQLTQASYRNVLDLFERKDKADKEFISDYFNVKESKFADALVNIESSVRSAADEGVEKIKKTLNALKSRLRREIAGTAAAATASVLSMIGICLLFASPAAPAGWVVLGTSSVIDLSRWIHHKFVEYKFAKAIDLQRTKVEWILC